MKTKSDSALCNRIMRRVYCVWFVKKVLPYLALESALFAGFIYVVGRQVYVANVFYYAKDIFFQNINHPLALANFATGVFWGTELIVQIAISGALVMLIFAFKTAVNSASRLIFAQAETKAIV